MAKRVQKKALEAARLLAGGLRPPAVAHELGMSETTIYRWMRYPDVISVYRECLTRAAVSSYARAFRVMDKQLDDANGWLAQGAARDIMQRFGDVVTGLSTNEIVVRVEGMPDIGMPDTPDE